MDSWSEKIINNIDSKLEGVREKDIRFFRVEEFKRNVKRLDAFSLECSFCQKQKMNVEEVSKSISDAIGVPGKARKEFDRLTSRLASHMQKEHGFYAPYYYTYLFSFFGMVAGTLLGYLLMKMVPEHSWEMLSIGFVIGLVTGYFIGFSRDKKIRTENKLL